MFKITNHKDDTSVKECIASTFSELPNQAKCEMMGINTGSSALIIDTSEVAILDEGYTWVKI